MKIGDLVTECPHLSEAASLDEALRALRKSGADAIILKSEAGDAHSSNRPERLVTRREILDALAEPLQGEETIGELVESTHPVVPEHEAPSEVIGILQSVGLRLAGVHASNDERRLLGVVAIADLMGLRAELTRAAMRDGLAVVSMLGQEIRDATTRTQRLERQGVTGRPNPGTGLHDARFLNRRLAEECERARRHHRVFTLLLMGVDTPGQAANLEPSFCEALRNAVYQSVADEDGNVKRALRRADIAAGYGTCEYAILLPETNCPNGNIVARRLLERMRGVASGLEAGTGSINIGLSTFGDSGRTRGELIRSARRALGVARAQGGSYVVGPDEMPGTPRPSGVTRLIRGSQLSVAFQPIMDTRTGKVFAYEALMRTKHPEFSTPPALFAMAERLGGVSALSASMLSMVAERMDEIPADVRVFVNLHPLDFTNVEFVESIVSNPDYSRFADRWVFELTECSAIGAYPRFMRCLQLFREAGFKTAIDDMGSGYAALTSIVAMNPAYIKLDMALIRNIHENATQQNIVRSLIAFARSQRTVEIIAEGVELQEERDFLRKIRCSYAQGYFVGRPSAIPGAATA